MGTTLLLFAHNTDEAVVKRAVPPSLWPGRVTPLLWGEEVLAFELPPEILADAREILPCLAIADSGAWAYQFTLAYTTQTGTQGRTALDPIGPFAQADTDATAAAVESAIDVLKIRAPLQSASLQLRTQRVNSQTPALLSVSIRDSSTSSEPGPIGQGATIAVPPRSQMVLRP